MEYDYGSFLLIVFTILSFLMLFWFMGLYGFISFFFGVYGNLLFQLDNYLVAVLSVGIAIYLTQIKDTFIQHR